MGIFDVVVKSWLLCWLSVSVVAQSVPERGDRFSKRIAVGVFAPVFSDGLPRPVMGVRMGSVSESMGRKGFFRVALLKEYVIHDLRVVRWRTGPVSSWMNGVWRGLPRMRRIPIRIVGFRLQSSASLKVSADSGKVTATGQVLLTEGGRVERGDITIQFAKAVIQPTSEGGLECRLFDEWRRLLSVITL